METEELLLNLKRLKCCCGGGKSLKIKDHNFGHWIESEGCHREIVPTKDIPVLLDNGMYLVNGEEITKRTLFGQWHYGQTHGLWTRAKDSSESVSVSG